MRPVSIVAALLAGLVGTGAPALARVPAAERAPGAVARGWVVVRTVASLPVAANGSTPFPTGDPALDAALTRARATSVAPALGGAIAALGRGDAALRARLGLDRTYLVRLAAGADWRAAIAALSGVPGVEWAEPDPVGHGAGTTPNDPRFPSQWGLSQSADNDIDAPEAWDIARGSASTVIAVLDTGVDFDHPDFAGALLSGYDFVHDDADPRDDSGHGTNVASIAAARSDNSASVAGVCWNCSILPLKVLDEYTYGYYSWWADGLVYAADRGAAVINMSMGGTGSSTLLRDAIRYAAQRGAVITAAMMNDGDATLYIPAVYEETVAVGATNEFDERAFPFCIGGGSNFGPHIDVSAPGDYILGARLGGGESYWCGTSQATAFVSGLAALALAANAGLGREESRHLLRSGAEDRAGGVEDTPGFDFLYGWGRLNAHRTLLAARSAASLRVSGGAGAPTRVLLAEKSPVAASYDLVRGDVAQVAEGAAEVGLGAVTCLLNDAAEPDLLGREDAALPPAGGAFFYLVRPNGASGAGEYGGSARHRDRRPASGDCAR
ncbi:MAG: S8 family serine peptidase [Acidobacteria bacterium]|jgi:subtilisin family serine protease|nr:S8 family serine peptidase [Acidobacteriota bacterium]